MTTEEKTQAYDEALERAKNLQHDNAWVTSIFPELAENDDERVRKELIGFLTLEKDRYTTTDYDKSFIPKCIAWLEKQKEQKPNYAAYLDLSSNEFEACMLRYLQSASNRKNDAMIIIDTIDYAAQLIEIAKKKQKPNIELIRRSWYMEGYHDRELDDWGAFRRETAKEVLPAIIDKKSSMCSYEEVVKEAITFADELIKQLKEE